MSLYSLRQIRSPEITHGGSAMQHNLNGKGVNSDIAKYFSRAKLPSQQETLGSVVVGILRSGETLNHQAICLKLMARLNKAVSPEEEQQLQALIGLLFKR